MTRITWDDPNDRSYTAGVDRGVIYPPNNLPATSWNGLVAVQANPSGGEISASYYDGERYYNDATQDSFAGKIDAFMYPEVLDGIDVFGLSYRVMTGDDSYEIHLVYNVLLTPISPSRITVSDSIEAETLSWSFSTKPLAIENARASAHLVVSSKVAYSWALSELEDLLYGTINGNLPTLPTPEVVVQLFENASIVKITDNGDGTWTAEGPDAAVYMVDATTFEINWPSAVYVDSESYTLTSL